MRNTLSASSVIVLNEYHASFVKNIEPFYNYQNGNDFIPKLGNILKKSLILFSYQNI